MGRYRNTVGDAIVIRKIATLSAAQARTFDLRMAINITLKNPHNLTDTTVEQIKSISNRRSIRVCGKPAFGFIIVRSITMPTFEAEPQKWKELDTYVLQAVGENVWQAVYSRLYEPGLELRQGTSLIDFTSRFCVQSHYK